MKTLDDFVSVRSDIESLLLRCGIPPQLQGFALLARAVFLFSPDDPRDLSRIYSVLADRVGYSERKVHRYIDYAISKASSLSDFFFARFGVRYHPYQLSNKLVVALLSICFRSSDKSEKLP